MIEALLLAFAIGTFALPLDFGIQLLIAGILLLLALPGVYGAGSGAPYAITHDAAANRMMDWAGIKPGMKVYDLGCGDGRLVFAAARLGATAIGHEISLPMYVIAKVRSLFHPGSRIELKDIWRQDYGDADVIVCYLTKTVMHRFEREIWPTLKPGCRVLSQRFMMPTIPMAKQEGTVRMYVK